jgi:outer membrane protein assembly factor BamE (lipoprotein component of BamABCDE complex)
MSCATTHINGQYVDDGDVEKVSKCGNKACVLSLLGSPTFVSQSEPNVTYYVSRTVKTIPLSKPKLYEQKITKLTFDAKDMLIEGDSKTDDFKSNLNLEKTTSFTHGKKETPLEHFFKNFGRFNSKRQKIR